MALFPLLPSANLSDLTSASTARTNLGLGTLATQSGTFSGTSSGTNTGDQTTVSGNAGTATALATARAIYGNNFDGSAALTQIIASTYGGTGNGFTKFSGPTTAERTFTLPDASATLLYSGGDAGTPSALVGTNITGTATGFTAGIANGLKSATTTVSVSSANAPTSGQVLTATGDSAATWQTPSGGGGTPTAITVADTSDSTCFVALFESATGDLGPKTDIGILYDASINKMTIGLGGDVTAGGFGGAAAVMNVLATSAVSGKYPQIAVRGPTDGGAAFQCYDGSGNASMDFGISHAASVAAFVNRMTSGQQWFYTHNGSALDVRLNIDATGNVVIGNGSNSAMGRLESRTTSGAQFVGAYDGSNYWTATTNSSGITTFNAASGSTPSFVFSDPISGLLTVGLGGSVTPSTGFGGGSASISLLMSDTTSATYPHLGLKGPNDGGCAFQMYNGGGTATGEIGVSHAASSLAIINRMNSGILSLYTTVSSTTASRLNIDTSGNVYVGTGLETALGRFDVRATSGAQLALSYDASNYITATVSSSGTCTLAGTGSNGGFVVGDSGDKVAFYGGTAVVRRTGAAQAAVATTAATNIAPYGFTTAAQADAIITLVNELRDALVALNAISGAA